MTTENDLVATGAVLGALAAAGFHGASVTSLELVTDAQGNCANQINLTFSHLRSPVRLTVEIQESE